MDGLTLCMQGGHIACEQVSGRGWEEGRGRNILAFKHPFLKNSKGPWGNCTGPFRGSPDPKCFHLEVILPPNSPHLGPYSQYMYTSRGVNHTQITAGLPGPWKEHAGYGGERRAQGPWLQPVRKKQGTIEPTLHCVKLPFLVETRTQR